MDASVSRIGGSESSDERCGPAEGPGHIGGLDHFVWIVPASAFVVTFTILSLSVLVGVAAVVPARLVLAAIATLIVAGWLLILRKLGSLGLAGTLLVALLFSAGAGSAFSQFIRAVIGIAAPEYREIVPPNRVAGEAAVWTVNFVSWIMAAVAIRFGQISAARKRDFLLQKDLAQKAQISALLYRLNPHFLFNSLNSVLGLLATARIAEAERLILFLSEHYKANAGHEPLEEVPLAEEIALQQGYLDIERIRFPDRLSVVVDVPTCLGQALVPFMLLQPLIENAVKHGVARSADATTVTMSARLVEDQLEVSIRDDAGGQGAADDGGSGLGLQIVRDRLHAYYGAAASLVTDPSDRGYQARLRLPLRLMA